MEIMSEAAVDHILKSSRSAIIGLLKENGAMSVEQLADSIHVSKVCVRRHLGLLESDGLIRYEEERHDRGRPRFMYRLTEKARCLFPQRYDELAREVLAEVERQFGVKGLDLILEARADEMIAQLKSEFEGMGFEERVRALTRVMSTRGYLADCRRQRDGSFRMRQRHCPTENIAIKYPAICEQEVRVYREAVDGEVVSDCRIADGHRVCEFRIMAASPTRISKREMPGIDEKYTGLPDMISESDTGPETDRRSVTDSGIEECFPDGNTKAE